jgi:CheY-like chemotaxis protein/HPt (histidine-containing phosphotransfer) domain-containing protein
MSDAATALRNAAPPPGNSRETPARRKRIVVFDQILSELNIPRALQGAGFEVLPKRVLMDGAAGAPDVILAEIGELTALDRRTVEAARAARPGILVVGVGSPVMVALAKGRRRAHNSPERRQGSGKRRVFDDFICGPFEVSSLLYLLQAWELAGEIREQATNRSSVNVSTIQALASMGGNMLLEELLAPGTSAVHESLVGIRQALVNRDSNALRNAAHHLQSTSGVFGAVRMTEIAALLERMGQAGLQDGANVLADSLEEEVGRFTKDLRALSLSIGGTSGGGASSKSRPATEQRPALNMRLLAPSYQGRRIAAHGLDTAMSERLDTLIRGLHASFDVVSAEDCCDGSWTAKHDLLMLSLGQEDVPELEAVRRVFETGNSAAIVVHLRDSGKELLEVAALAAESVAPPGDSSELLLAGQRVLLHLDAIPAAPRKPAGAGAIENEVKPRLLVAEDEPFTARFLIGSLEAGGFEVTHAATGAEAIAAFGARRFDAAVLDINMPEADGFDVLEHVRKDPLHRDMPVLMLSSRSQERDIVKAFDLGADDYVMKPFSPPEVVLRLRKLAGRH